MPKLYDSPGTFDAQVALHANPFYMARLWVYFAHPFLVLTAAWGVAARKLDDAAGAATTGFLFFGFWGFTEAAQQALSLIALNFTWRASYARSTDEALRTMLRTNIFGFDAIWDALFFLLLIGFMLGNLLYGVATRRGIGLEKVLSGLFFFISAFTLLNVLRSYAGAAVLPSFLSWIYPVVQPIARVLIGIWLWQSMADVPAALGERP
jgi:hypothetical protein